MPTITTYWPSEIESEDVWSPIHLPHRAAHSSETTHANEQRGGDEQLLDDAPPKAGGGKQDNRAGDCDIDDLGSSD